jgi:predicted porin
MKKSFNNTLLLAGCALFAGAASAEDTATINGITFYGVIDVALTYDTHGAPPPPQGGTIGSDWAVQKNSNRSILEMAQSGMSQSRWGIKGAEDIGGGWMGLFKLEGAINPLAGTITDAQRTIASNNGIAQAQQSAFGDSAINGQLFSRAAFGGLSHPQYGTVTFGRNTTFENDAVAAYDPDGQGYAFSLIGFSGATAGAGRTEDSRWDNSVKYLGSYGPARFGAMYQLGGTVTRNDTGFGGDLGFDYAGFSFDGVYTVKKDMVSAAPLTAAQVLSTVAAGYNPQNSISATVSDNVAFGLNLKYAWEQFKFYAGYEHIKFGNARSPLPVGFINIGQYIGSVVSNTGAQGELLQVSWVGARYQVTPKLEAIVSWDRYDQNSFKGNGCSDTSAASCSGSENTASLVFDYHFTNKVDAYAGAMYSHVLNGLASGFYHSNNIDPTIGLRFSW